MKNCFDCMQDIQGKISCNTFQELCRMALLNQRNKFTRFYNCQVSVSPYHINQEPRVLCIIFRVENKSRKSPSFSSHGNFNPSSGISLPFSRAILLKMFLASDSRPFFRSQRTDSGIKLKENKLERRMFCNKKLPAHR